MIELKKNPKKDLNKYTGLFLNIGLVITLLLVILAFEVKVYDDGSQVNMSLSGEEFEDLLDIPQTQQPPPPKPKKVQPEIISVPDEEEIEEDIEIDLDIEMVEETVIEDVIFEEAPEEEEVDEIFTFVQDEPLPVGGISEFYKFVSDNLKYPAQARRMGIEGRVFIQFVVDKKGNLTDIKAVKGIGAGCDEEAVRIVGLAPKWNAGKQRGRPVRVRMIIPIVFQLN